MSVQYPLFFEQRFKGKVLFDVPMSGYTSFGIGGPADVMAFPRDESDLKEILSFAAMKRFHLYILGMGTNVLVRDGGIRGVVINMSGGFNDLDWREETFVVAGAGVRVSALVAECAARGLGGVEFAVGIPGSVGGAARMNAGAYGHEMKDIVDGVEVMDRKGRRGFLSRAELNFTYRSSSVPDGSVITRVHMRFKKADAVEVKKKIQEYALLRKEKGFIKPDNAGSVFKNPEGAVAGKLIEEAGFKGAKEGAASVSMTHANYIVNNGGARASDVLALMALIRDGVYKKTGIVLEPEIKVIGED